MRTVEHRMGCRDCGERVNSLQGICPVCLSEHLELITADRRPKVSRLRLLPASGHQIRPSSPYLNVTAPTTAEPVTPPSRSVDTRPSQAHSRYG